MSLPKSTSLVVNSPAKINLFLDVISKRPDGYHNIVTLFERIGLSDTIRLIAINSNEIIVACDNPNVPTDHTNLAFRAADLLRKSLNIKQGVKIEIEKRIPVGAGLGGGSSNAASVLLGLNKLFKLGLDKKALIGYANRLGSDVAFFILNQRFAIGSEKGGMLKPVSVAKTMKLWHVLFILPHKILTRDVYSRHQSLALTKNIPDVNIQLRYLREKNISGLNRAVYNELSVTVMKSYRFVLELKSDLCKFGLKYIHMSGSGPTLFSIHKTQKEAQKVVERIGRRLTHKCSTYVVSTL